jgi:hypothetical protein
MTLTLITYKNVVNSKDMWFYIDEENTVVSPYFYSEQEALDWKMQNGTDQV